MLGDEVGGDVADPDPAQCVGGEVHSRQCHCHTAGFGQRAVAELHHHVQRLGPAVLDDLHRSKRRRGRRLSVPEAVDHPEQRGATADVERDRMVAAHLFTRSRAAHRGPLDRPEPAMPKHRRESTSTSR